MESPKYLIIVTLIDGQNFALPDGAPEKIEATVFAEARFGNESILKSDPIKLTNSNPEFVTELAWQLEKKTLHQLKVERKAIKLQIFMQTKEKKKRQLNEPSATNGIEHTDANSTNKVELIGYTVIDIRSAQETEQPKFQWVPLLNPKFKKSVYNRPEIQIALTLNRIDDDVDIHKPLNTLEVRKEDCSGSVHSESNETYYAGELEENSKLYKTCLDFTLSPEEAQKDEIIENDIVIRSVQGQVYIYDQHNTDNPNIDSCRERYKITITIPFSSELDYLINNDDKSNYFEASLFGSSKRTDLFGASGGTDTKEIEFLVNTTHSNVLTTYFELNSDLIIKLHNNYGETLGVASIQLDQLCSLNTRCRSIEGIFALRTLNDHDIPSDIHPTIGVSILIEKLETELANGDSKLLSEEHIEMAKEHFGDDIDDYLYKTLNDTHQLTMDNTLPKNNSILLPTMNNIEKVPVNHHFCFTIDLKSFSYTSNQRLIPTIRELVVRYSYPFFGYKDTITTDASVPLNSTSSIIVSGFCEFNFATTKESLFEALKEIPLDLDILTCDHINLNLPERVIAMCNLNLAQIMNLNEENIQKLAEKPISTTVSPPILGLDGEEIGELQVYLCLKDLGQPNYDLRTSCQDLVRNTNDPNQSYSKDISPDEKKLESFMTQIRTEFELWKDDFIEKFSDESRKRENERFKRLYQRFEVKEAKREQEFRKKMEELSGLERKLRNSVAFLESHERKLTNSFDQLKAKDGLLETRLEALDLKISQALIDMRFENDNSDITRQPAKIPHKSNSDAFQIRRSSLRNPSCHTNATPMPIRSSSLVKPNDAMSFKFVKKPTNVVTTVVNGIRPNRLNLSKETQEKLTSLRREKAELLKRGCRPSDELIQEINSMIEKLAC